MIKMCAAAAIYISFLLVPVCVDAAKPANGQSLIRAGQNMSNAEKLTVAGFLPLRKAEIEHALLGKRITPDPDVSQMALPFFEEFRLGGSWFSTRKERREADYSGTWSIENSLVCVRSAELGQICRSVWHNPATGRLAISDIRQGSTKLPPVIVIVSG